MNETSRAHNATHSPDAPAEKRPWHAPKLEEVDYTETQVGAVGPYISDFTTYHS